MATPACWLGRISQLARKAPLGNAPLPVRDYIITQALAGNDTFTLPRTIRMADSNHLKLLEWLRSQGLAYNVYPHTMSFGGECTVKVSFPRRN